MSGSQICIWDLQSQVCRKVLSHHEYDIVCLAFSRDDKFLVSVGKQSTAFSSLLISCLHIIPKWNVVLNSDYFRTLL